MERVEGWPGVGLSGDEMLKVPHVEYAPRLRYSFSAGEAMSRFLEEMRAGRFVARRCNHCARHLFPPRMFCEECYRPTDAWVPVPDRGTIQTFSVSYLDLNAKRIKEPIFVGIIGLDEPGTTKRAKGRPYMGLMHYIGEIPKDPTAPYGYGIKVGMRVKAVWKKPEERTGSILDVRHFRPITPQEDHA